MKRRFSLLFAIVLLLSVPFLVSGLTPEKPYPDLADGDQLTATWLMGTFNTLYSWSQGTNATVTAHIATYTPHARMDGATLNTPKITSGTASGTVLTNCSIAGLSLSGTTINSGTMSGGTVTGVTVSNSTIGSTNSIDGGAVKSGTVADARIDAALARDSELAASMSAANASDALNLRLDGSRAMTGSLKFSGNYGIFNTADTGFVTFAGGGAAGNSHGGLIWACGNLYSTQGGQLQYCAGNVSTGDHVFYTGAGTERFRIAYDGTITAKSYLTTTGYGVKSGSDSDALRLVGGSTLGPAYGSYCYFFGASHATYPGQAQYYAANVSTGHHMWHTGNGSERMRLTYGGNLLINTTTDDGTNKLQVNGIAFFKGGVVLPNDLAYRCKNTSGTPRPILYIDTSDITRLGTPLHATRIDSNGTLTHNGNTVWTAASDGAGSGLDADTVDGYAPSVINTANTLVLRDANGDAIVATMTCAKLSAFTAYVDDIFKNGILSGTGNRLVYSTSTGVLTNSSSDARMKRNVSTIGGALGKVLSLRGVYYNWNAKEAEKLGDQREIGMIAQEVEKVIPEVVGTNGTGMKSLDYPKLVAVLVEAIKDMNKLRKSDNAALLRKIEKQEREIDELREEMRVMRSLFEAPVGGKADYYRMDGKHVGEYIQTH